MKNNRIRSLFFVTTISLTATACFADSYQEIDWIGYQWETIEKNAPYQILIEKDGSEVDTFYCHHWEYSWTKKTLWTEQAARCINTNAAEVKAGQKQSDGTIVPVRHASNNRVWSQDPTLTFQIISNALNLIEIDILSDQFGSLTPNLPISVSVTENAMEHEKLLCSLDEADWSSRGNWSQAMAHCINDKSQRLVAGQLEFATGKFIPSKEDNRNRVLAPTREHSITLTSSDEEPSDTGTITLTLPEASQPELAGQPITGRLVHSPSGESINVTGQWGETLVFDDLAAADYQLLMDPAQGYVPRNTPVVFNLSDETPQAEYDITYRPPIAVDLLSGLPGVEIELFYQGLYQPRQMAEGNGVIYVGSSAIPLDDDPLSGQIYALVQDPDTNEIIDSYVVAHGMEEPHGIAYRDGDLYFSTVGGLYRIEDIDSRYANMPNAEEIYTYPANQGDGLDSDFRNWHQKHPIKFNPLDSLDNGIYTAVGIPCNVCIMPNELYGTLYRIDLEDFSTQIIAKGIRNSVGFDWNPISSEIWFSDNNRQGMDNPDEINRVSQWGKHFGTPYVFGRDTIGILPGEEDGSIPTPMPKDAILSDISIDQIDPTNYAAASFEVETNSAPLGVTFWDGYPSDTNQQHLLFATHGNGQKGVRPALELRMMTIEDLTNVAHERSLIQGWMQNIDEVDSYACLNDACIGRPVEMLTLEDGSLLLSDDKANVIYKIHYDATLVNDNRVTLNVPALPDLDAEAEMISGQLMLPDGEKRRFYMNWHTSELNFDGLPSGDYELMLDPINQWYPQPATQSFSLYNDNDQVSLDWYYSADAEMGQLILQAPEAPASVDSETTTVNVNGSGHSELYTLAWGESKTVQLTFGEYQVSFGYQYGALPSPLRHTASLTSSSPSDEVNWAMREVESVGETVLNESCSACHGNNASGLDKEEVARRWIELGFDALQSKTEAMPMYCDPICSDQVARTLWQERWAPFDPPALPDPEPPEPGDAPQATIVELTVNDNNKIFVAFDYFTIGGASNNLDAELEQRNSTESYSVDGLDRQQVELRYLQPTQGKWLTVGELDNQARQHSFTPEFGGLIEVRIVSLDEDGGVTYSETSSIEVLGLPTSGVGSENLELFWDFDYANVFKVTDRSGNELDLQLTGQAFTPDGVVNDALLPGQDGANRQLADDELIDLNSNGMTWSFWMHPTQSFSDRIRLFHSLGTGLFSVLRGGATLWIGTDNNPSRFSVGGFEVDRWTHVTYTREANGDAALYKDGELIATKNHSTDVHLTNLRISDFRENAALDELRLYSRVLTQAEILSLYQYPGESDKDGDNGEGGGEEPDVGDLDGEELYMHFNCASCHGDDGLGNTPILDSLYGDRDYLINLISTTMPYGNVGACDLECAEKLYEWMFGSWITGGGGGGNPPTGGNDSGLDGLVTSWEAQGLYYKITENLISRQPNEEEIEYIHKYGADAIDELLAELMEEKPFIDRMEEIFNDLMHVLGTPNLRNDGRNFAHANGGNHTWTDTAAGSNTSLRNYLRSETDRALQREGLALIRHIIENDLPFTEILTADYTMVNYFTAAYYGFENQFNFRKLDNPPFADAPWDPDHFEMVKLKHPHAGVITNVAFMLTYPTTKTNINRARAASFYQMFLDTDIMAIGGERPGSDDLEQENATLTNPACTGCHEVMDPVASAFKHWVGEFTPDYKVNLTDNDWPLHTILPLGFNGEQAPYYTEKPLQWLTERAAKDPRFAKAMVKHLFEPVTGHDLLMLPEPDADRDLVGAYQRQQKDIAELAKRFEASGYQFKALIRELVFTEYTQRFNRFDGSRRLMTPEVLDRKLTALTGRDWRYRGGQRWLHRSDDKLNLMYGGIDDQTVVDRDYQLNGVSAAIQNFLAADFACQVVPVEFSQEPKDRNIFTNLEADGYRLRYELEDADLEGATVETNHNRYTGTGYVLMTTIDQSLSFTVMLEHDDIYDLALSYSQPNPTDRHVELWINDEHIQDVVLPQTTNNSRWNNASIEPIALNAGRHEVRLVKINNNSHVNLDNLSFHPRSEEESRIRDLLVDLIWRFYGEEVDHDDSQVDRAYDLFRYAQEQGSAMVYDLSVDQQLPQDCRAYEHLSNDEEAATEDHVNYDAHFYTRSWITVLTYLLKDQRFFYE